MKHCSKCDRELPLTEFQRNKSTPDGLQRWCKSCRRSHYYEPERKQRKVAYDRQRRTERGDEFRAQARERYHNDPDYHARRIESGRQYRTTPAYQERERLRHHKRWADPEYRRMRIAKHRERRHRDPEYRRKVYYWRRARKMRIKLQGRPFTHAEWIQLCERYDHCCLACGQRKPLSPDHIVPVSRGGSSDISNIQPLCVDCNKRKSARTIDYRTPRQAGFEWGD